MGTLPSSPRGVIPRKRAGWGGQGQAASTGCTCRVAVKATANNGDLVCPAGRIRGRAGSGQARLRNRQSGGPQGLGSPAGFRISAGVHPVQCGNPPPKRGQPSLAPGDAPVFLRGQSAHGVVFPAVEHHHQPGGGVQPQAAGEVPGIRSWVARGAFPLHASPGHAGVYPAAGHSGTWCARGSEVSAAESGHRGIRAPARPCGGVCTAWGGQVPARGSQDAAFQRASPPMGCPPVWRCAPLMAVVRRVGAYTPRGWPGEFPCPPLPDSGVVGPPPPPIVPVRGVVCPECRVPGGLCYRRHSQARQVTGWKERCGRF